MEQLRSIGYVKDPNYQSFWELPAHRTIGLMIQPATIVDTGNGGAYSGAGTGNDTPIAPGMDTLVMANDYGTGGSAMPTPTIQTAAPAPALAPTPIIDTGILSPTPAPAPIAPAPAPQPISVAPAPAPATSSLTTTIIPAPSGPSVPSPLIPVVQTEASAGTFSDFMSNNPGFVIGGAALLLLLLAKKKKKTRSHARR